MTLIGDAKADESECTAPCDCSVVPGRGKWRYEARGDRCEGQIDQPIAFNKKKRPPLQWVSFTLGRLDAVQSKSPDVHLSWTSTPEEVHLTAAPRAPSVYYRMDANLAGGAEGFTWKLDVLHAASVNLLDLGVLLKTPQDVHRPIVTTSPTSPGSTAYYFVVVPRNVVKNVTAQIFGATGKPVDSPPISTGTYASEQGIGFSIPAPHAPGSFSLHLEAQCVEGCGGKSASVVSDYSFQIP